jgi:hypothetical protein
MGAHVGKEKVAFEVKTKERLGSGFWVLGSGFWVLGSGFWVLGSGFWVLGLL